MSLVESSSVKKPLALVWINFWFWSGLPTVALALCGLGLLTQPADAEEVQNSNQNSIIDVGVVQRFGSAPSDVITLKPVEGDRLTLKFADQGVEKKVVTTNEVTLNVTLQPLPQPQVKERVVLSSHRSFESAEDSAD
jgi:hypothetical protein